ncbi:hypothetical protein JZ751_005551 [Albula glossodonta]|uniref:Uncharacterized protein n=1 Tax=Albula glossodonta TaxID=121402 RepID=A0A8T2N450_9TELE|nr:hypothetical protein JZ751_005551 [Albula glossodonta]
MFYEVITTKFQNTPVSENAKKDLKDGLALYNTDNNVGLKNAWNIIQAEWKCCGVTGYTDWHEALKEKVVPDRCCQEHYKEAAMRRWRSGWTIISTSWGRLGSPGHGFLHDSVPADPQNGKEVRRLAGRGTEAEY